MIDALPVQPSPFIRAWDRHQETQECAMAGCKKVAVVRGDKEESAGRMEQMEKSIRSNLPQEVTS